MLKKLLFGTLSLSLIFACQNTETTADDEIIDISEEEGVPLEPEHDSPESYEKGGLKIYPKEQIAEFPDAGLEVLEPESEAIIDGESVNFRFKVQDYELSVPTEKARMGLAASDKGQHIHLIVDNDPYNAIYDSTFSQSYPAGNHYAIAFLSRSYHESVKSDGAAQVFQFVTGTGDEDDPKMIDIDDEPLLFYSRPKGTYSGKDAEKILFDFYVENAELSEDGYSVLTTINDSLEFNFDVWQPYIIEGLPMGENTIKISLVDAKGVPVYSEVNTTTRTFTLEK